MICVTARERHYTAVGCEKSLLQVYVMVFSVHKGFRPIFGPFFSVFWLDYDF